MPLPKEMLNIPPGLISLSSPNFNFKSHPGIWAW